MATFLCSCGYKIVKEKIKFRVEGRNIIVDEQEVCPICKQVMSLQTKELTVGDVSFTHSRFNSLSSGEKKEMLHKRAQQHFERYDKTEVERKRSETIHNIKQKFEEGTK